jgi:hypothetical protein
VLQRALLCLARTDHAAGASMDLLARRLVSAHACSGEGSARRRLFGLLDAHVLEVRGYRTDARPLLALAPSVQAFVTGQLAEVLDPTG